MDNNKLVKSWQIFLLLALITSCEKAMEGEIYKVYDDKMLDELLEESQLTTFLSVVDKADMTGTIHAYGAYTLFAPTNEALTEHLQSTGKNDVNALSREEAADIVTYHLVRDTLRTTDFTDGRLPTPNFQKKYLMTKYENKGTTINRQARIIGENIRGANGILHIIDKTLTPPENSITDAVRALPDADYSIFKSFFEMSGWTDSLDVEKEDLWYTLFIQDNNAFAEAGITGTDDLLAQLREFTPAIENSDTLVHNYIGYHIIKTRLYITDLMYLSSMQTVVPK
ncbi:MAG: fasciclin domain-containing protein, partial [Dysgonamonadaceae bacterium]|nr:fasciclin domain-containing protein [Dysgonamonadaceae bacterium]